MDITNPNVRRAKAALDTLKAASAAAAEKEAKAKQASINATDPNCAGVVAAPTDDPEATALMPGHQRPESTNSNNIGFVPNHQTQTDATEGKPSVPVREFSDGSPENKGMKQARNLGDLMRSALKVAAEVKSDAPVKDEPKTEGAKTEDPKTESPKAASIEDEISYSYGKIASIGRIMLETADGRAAVQKAILTKKANLQLKDLEEHASKIASYEQEFAKQAAAQQLLQQGREQLERELAVKFASLSPEQKLEITATMQVLAHKAASLNEHESYYLSQGAAAMKRALDETPADAEELVLPKVPSEDIVAQAPTIDEQLQAIAILAQMGKISPEEAEALAQEIAAAAEGDIPAEAVPEEGVPAEVVEELPAEIPAEDVTKAASAILESSNALLADISK